MSTSKPKRKRGRPVKYPLPELIPDTAENIMRPILNTPPKARNEWRYMKEPRRDKAGQ